MFPFPPTKSVLVFDARGITAAATQTGNIDRKDFDFVKVQLYATTVAATSNTPSVLKISEADDTNATSFADVTALVGGGAGGFTIPNWPTVTTGPLVAEMNIDCRTRKRYLKLSVSPRTTQDLIALAVLGRAKVAPESAADVNVVLVANA